MIASRGPGADMCESRQCECDGASVKTAETAPPAGGARGRLLRVLWLSHFLILAPVLSAASLQGCSRPPQTGVARPADQQRTAEVTPPVDASVATGDERTGPGRSADSSPAPAVSEHAPAESPADGDSESTYDSSPPYPEKLRVRSPADRQPGWLSIIEMADEKVAGTAEGTFPEQNRILVKTDNVKRIRIHIGHLPLNPGARTVLNIDGQPIEILRKHREYLHMERLSTGAWVVRKDDD
jgi:hypothetical protein